MRQDSRPTGLCPHPGWRTDRSKGVCLDNPAALADSVSLAYLQGLVDCLGRHGVDPDALLRRGRPSPEILARREAGLSFNQLLDETRQQLLLHYLRDPLPELTEPAVLIGFGESARWSVRFTAGPGRTPANTAAIRGYANYCVRGAVITPETLLF